MATQTRLQLREKAVSLLSRKWTLRIVRALDSSVKRHSELARTIPGVTQKVLTETLREMECCGIVERSIYPTVPPRVEYKLTNTGIGLLKITSEFSTWFDTHRKDMRKAQRFYDQQRNETSLT